MSLARRLGRLMLIAALAVASPRWSGAQSFEFHAPPSAADPKTPAVMRDLAERLLPVYQESDPDRYLANLSVLQLTAGDYSAAVESRESLHERRRRADSAGWSWLGAHLCGSRVVWGRETAPFDTSPATGRVWGVDA